MGLSIDVIPNRSSPPAILLRRSWREGKRIRRETIANLSKMPPDLISALGKLLKGGVVYDKFNDVVRINRSWHHGHALATLGMARKLGLDKILHRRRSRQRDLALAAILARILHPGSKHETARMLSSESTSTSLGAMLGLGRVTGHEMLAMLDWLCSRQKWIEQSLANRHLAGGTLILYDVSSSYVEGSKCSLAAFGHNRDGKKGRKQVTYGLLCASDGCPVAIEVFRGNTGDPSTLSLQLDKVRERFGIRGIAVVGDRGMITSARIREDLQPRSLGWISALTTDGIRALMRPLEEDEEGMVLDPATLVPDAVAELYHPSFPGERLLVCLNPRLRDERARKREDLLRATEEALAGIARMVHRPGSKLRGKVAIARRIGREANRRKVEKHFDITMTDDRLSFSRKEDRIAREAQLDGIYVVRTNLPSGDMSGEDAVEAYKGLSRVEQAFRFCKSRLDMRPIYVYTDDHVRGHFFLVMLAWYVEWHMRRRLAPLLFEDDNPEGAKAKRDSPVSPAVVSDEALAKYRRKETPDGLPVHSMTTLLADLSGLTLNEVVLPSHQDHAFTTTSEPTRLQARAFELLEIRMDKGVAM